MARRFLIVNSLVIFAGAALGATFFAGYWYARSADTADASELQRALGYYRWKLAECDVSVHSTRRAAGVSPIPFTIGLRRSRETTYVKAAGCGVRASC